MLFVNADIIILDSELEMKFIRASGPGGQNVNKVASAVQLRFSLGKNRSLLDDVKARLRKLSGKKLTGDDEVIIEAKRFRSQEMNREDALSRLRTLILKALETPKKRKKSKPSLRKKEERLKEKHLRSGLKKRRQAPSHEED